MKALVLNALGSATRPIPLPPSGRWSPRNSPIACSRRLARASKAQRLSLEAKASLQDSRRAKEILR